MSVMFTDTNVKLCETFLLCTPCDFYATFTDKRKKQVLTLTEEVRTHHGCLVLVDHHFFSFRNYAGARDKTKNSKAAGTSMFESFGGWTFNKV